MTPNAHATVAALILMNGYGIAPHVQPAPAGFRLTVPRETPHFTRLANYMTRFTELHDSVQAWQPFTVYTDALEVLGVALSPWLLGGANYLRSMLNPMGFDLPSPEWVPAERWFGNLDVWHVAYSTNTDDADVHAVLNTIRAFWEAPSGLVCTSRLQELLQYWDTVQTHVARLGLVVAPSRIREMKTRMAAHTDSQ